MHSGGRHHPPRPAAENPQVARRSAVGDRQRKASRRYTDRCGTFACRTATVAPGVNAHDERPSVCGATVEGRSAPPSSTAIWRWSADCPPFFEMRRDPGTLPRPPHRDATRPCGRERVRLPIFMERRFTERTAASQIRTSGPHAGLPIVRPPQLMISSLSAHHSMAAT